MGRVLGIKAVVLGQPLFHFLLNTVNTQGTWETSTAPISLGLRRSRSTRLFEDEDEGT